MNAPLNQLASFVATGDDAAFRALVANHERLVRSACARVLDDPGQIDDAVQETFWSLARQAGRVKRNLAAWLHACAVNHALMLRRANLRRGIRERASAPGEAVDGQENESWAELRPALDTALAELEEPVREAVIRHVMMGEPLSAIGAEAGISAPAVHQRVQKGLERLRLNLRRRGVGLAVLALVGLLGGTAAPAAEISGGLAGQLPHMILAARALGRKAAATLNLVKAAVVVAVIGLGGWLLLPGSRPAGRTPAPVLAAAAPNAPVRTSPPPPAQAAVLDQEPVPVKPDPASGAGPPRVEAPPSVAARPATTRQLFQEPFFDFNTSETGRWKTGLRFKNPLEPDAPPCCSLMASGNLEDPPRWFKAETFHFELFMRPRFRIPAEATKLEVGYRLRLSASHGVQPTAVFPFLDVIRNGGTVTFPDDLVPQDLPQDRWLAIVVAFERAGTNRWRQAITVDGKPHHQTEIATTLDEVTFVLRHGLIELADITCTATMAAGETEF